MGIYSKTAFAALAWRLAARRSSRRMAQRIQRLRIKASGMGTGRAVR